MEDTVRKEELKSDHEFRKTEESLINNLKSSLDQAIQSHEKEITRSIRQYENALKDAAQLFIQAKTEAEADYIRTLKQHTGEMHRLLDDARITRNNRIDACHRRIRPH